MLKYLRNIIIPLKAISADRINAFLSSFAIIVSSGSLILLFAVFNGNFKTLTQQIQTIGETNIIISPKLINNISDKAKIASPGLTPDDVQSIKSLLPNLKYISPILNFKTFVSSERAYRQANIKGVSGDFVKMTNINIFLGKNFTKNHFTNSSTVCLISSELKISLFGNNNPIGKWVKCNNLFFNVVGVYKANYNNLLPNEINYLNGKDVIITPFQTLALRYDFPENQSANNLNSIYLSITDKKHITATKEIIRRTLIRKHFNNEDFKIYVPAEIIKQKFKNKLNLFYLFTIFIIIILIISGISIYQYIKITGLSRGNLFQSPIDKTTSSNFLFQLLFQGTFISFIASLIGILAGIAISKILFIYFSINSVISLLSILFTILIYILTGLVFSYFPSKKITKKLSK